MLPIDDNGQNCSIATMTGLQVLCLALGLLSLATLSHGCGNILNIHVDEMKNFTLDSSSYTNNMNCTYTVTGTGGREIELSFTSFDVEWQASCRFDSIEVKDGDGTSLGTYCGIKAPGPFISLGFFIIFSTDSSITKGGFTMAFAYFDCKKYGGECVGTCGEGKESVGACSSTKKCCVNNPLPSECGKVPATSAGTYRSGARIVDGVDAKAHSWPWQVSLQYNQSHLHFCGGSLISNRWVVTAAHCVDGQSISDFKVRVGEHHTEQHDSGNKLETTGEDVRVEKYIKHELYGVGNGTSPNDIALVKLATAVTYDNKIQPACVPGKGDTFGNSSHNCWITGWGSDSDDSSKDEYVLQALEVNTITNDECTEEWGSGRINERHVCVMDARNNVNIGGACNGDSGGPLACQNRKDDSAPFWLAGATSWGINGCTTSGYPAVYSRVSEFRQWIIRKMVTE